MLLDGRIVGVFYLSQEVVDFRNRIVDFILPQKAQDAQKALFQIFNIDFVPFVISVVQ